ncbi:uncharacterized protein VP01_3948g1 [Puccinia sorghi]|uniref:Uncharacterized protein n=1 Tax=Puccinia sorghi TaxID=27349 RepID=A0A0L6USE3_9BASI|nr:uncharacterized protein VP01_3948g1 [Puccinia sorghi]
MAFHGNSPNSLYGYLKFINISSHKHQALYNTIIRKNIDNFHMFGSLTYEGLQAVSFCIWIISKLHSKLWLCSLHFLTRIATIQDKKNMFPHGFASAHLSCIQLKQIAFLESCPVLMNYLLFHLKSTFISSWNAVPQHHSNGLTEAGFSKIIWHHVTIRLNLESNIFIGNIMLDKKTHQGSMDLGRKMFLKVSYVKKMIPGVIVSRKRAVVSRVAGTPDLIPSLLPYF